MIIKLIILFLAGTAAGFFNVFAGGGSTLTLPALIFLGLPPTVANGTNRIAIFFQNISATLRFKRDGYFFLRTALILSIPTIVGAIIGSLIAVRFPEELFKKVILGVMLLSLVFILKRKKSPQSNKVMENKRVKFPPIIFGTLFLVGIYGGIIQAGVGFIFIMSLSLLEDLDLVQINSIKLLIVLIYTFPVIIIFLLNSKINILFGLILASGNSLGGWLGAYFSVKKGDKLVKIIFAIAIIVMALKLLEIF